MIKKTIISHFFNEEYLLPWWLNHHKQFFDHGILIDYHSTDNSRSIIKEICPNWGIINTSNEYFDSHLIDKEVQEIEKYIKGWKVCLNTTEFLVGDYGIIDSMRRKRQILLGNYVFVDIEKKYLDHNIPLYDQIKNGFHEKTRSFNVGIGDRSLRSMHSFNLRYPKQGGRHFFGRETTQDLFIFYYGYLLKVDQMIKRKIQIQSKMSEIEQKKLRSYKNARNIL
jgi:hypothetical protein